VRYELCGELIKFKEALFPEPGNNIGPGMAPVVQNDSLPRYTQQAQQPYVVYETHLHPTYQTPVLWFSLHDLPSCEVALDIETVYRYLVPDQYKDHLRTVGVIGGISAAVWYFMLMLKFIFHC
jgi:Autophagocytosis associated protein, active-site domain